MESIKQLTEKLDGLRREIDEIEKQIQEEDDEFQAQKAALLEKRDEKKTALKEKEDASRDLRKEVASLERSNASAQTRRTQQEKSLRQKEAERRKLKEDMSRWAREADELRAAAEGIQKERADYEATAEKRIQDLKDKFAEETQMNKSLEDIIREKGTQIKALEEERKQLEDGEEPGDAQEGMENVEADEDRRWQVTLAALQQQYAQAWSLFSQAERANQEATNRLHFLQQRRLSQPQIFGSMSPQDAAPRRRPSQRSRPVSMREPFSTAAPGGFIHTSAAPFNGTMPTISPSVPNATPYFNINNGMALPLHSSANISSFSHSEIESLTGGAPMSPTAGALLPSGLFGDDSGLTDAEDDDEDDPGPPQPTLDPSPNLRHVLPGLGAPGTLEQVQSPSSPVSIQSRSPSVFASPRDSAGQLAYYPTNENAVDSDRRSIRSTSSSFLQNAPTTRFGSLFGLNRQRGKTISEQGPTLGSLKASQSQSLPRQEPDELDPIGTQRRRGSHSEGAWYNSLLRSSKTQPIESSSPKHVTTRKRPFNMFGSKGDPWLTSVLGTDRPSSPRQGSTKSGEASVLPRPSTESQTRFGWSVDAFGARSSPLGVDWSMNNTSSWSRMPSRRPSLQHGSTASLVHDDLLQGDYPDFPSTSMSPTQAPIGTRPQSSASHMPPIGPVPPTPPKALNPAAPHFKSIFLREKKSDEDKAEKAKKAAEKAAEKEAKKMEKKEEKKAKGDKSDKASRKEKEKMLASDASHDSGRDTSSPMDPRQSRDGHSISTLDVSEASPRESLERSVSLTPSDSQANANALNKETLMQKLSRKSSTSQFLQFGKNKTSIFSKKANGPATPDEIEEEAGGYMGKSVDSVGNSPSIGTPKDKSSALSWSSIKRIGKRGDKTPSLHESIASETTGDEDEDEESVKVTA
jgi:chemotaxis protein histidine kinase CheA